jgi:steroid 5-alpha reductase family enzyme
MEKTFMIKLLMISLVTNILIMIGTWFFARSKNNYSVVDAVWAFSFFITSGIYTILGNGLLQRRLLILLCVSIWSLRLGIFLARRIFSHHPTEDSRYVELRKGYGAYVARGFFWFFQYQAYSVVLLSAPFLLMALNPEPQVNSLEYLGAILFFICLSGEAIADHQAQDFKKNPENKNKVCDVGLWRYSRHPNYFFESGIWFSFFIMAYSSPYGIYTLFAPLLILFLLLKVTGVPMSESQSLKNRGEAYREYQKKTSKFIPWFPKKLAILLILIAPLISKADEIKRVPPARLAKIYAIGKTNEEPLFIQKTNYKKVGDQIEANTVITDQKNTVVMTEVAYYKEARLVSQIVDQHQTQEHYEVEVKNEKVYFRQRKMNEKDDQLKEASEKYTDQFCTGPVVEEYFLKHWNLILDKKTLSADFGVPELKKSVSFEFKLKELTQFNGREVARINMKAANFVVRMVVDTITMDIDLNDKRYVRYIGRTPLHIKNKNKLQPFDAEILYQ